MVKAGNLFASLPAPGGDEDFATLATIGGARIEWIVSTGQASPPGFWYDQDWTEWVVVLSGAAALTIEGEAGPRRLAPGDYVEIPSHVRHRIEWTDAAAPTVWLAIHEV
jgi:cupin 2 domain-containing protein